MVISDSMSFVQLLIIDVDIGYDLPLLILEDSECHIVSYAIPASIFICNSMISATLNYFI